MLNVRLGWSLLGIAGALAMAAVYIWRKKYGVTMTALADDHAHGLVNRIPSYTVAFGTCGAFVVSAWLVRRWKRLPPDHDRP